MHVCVCVQICNYICTYAWMNACMYVCTQPLGIWSTRWLLFLVMANIPKMGHLPTSDQILKYFEIENLLVQYEAYRQKGLKVCGLQGAGLSARHSAECQGSAQHMTGTRTTLHIQTTLNGLD